VETIGWLCFDQCSRLSSLTFSSPIQVRELLSIPPLLARGIEIPDSVEIFGFIRERYRVTSFTLHFGRDSRLAHLKAMVQRPCWSPDRHPPSFAHFSTRALKRFRLNMEFGEKEFQDR
jgi:hypothetical protein